MNNTFHLKLTCKNCNGISIVDFEQLEETVFPAETKIECPKTKSGEHQWLTYFQCPECDQEKLFPVNNDGEPLQARCDSCIKQFMETK